MLRVSYLEIYNEIINDLLQSPGKGSNLTIREDKKRGVFVEGLKEEIVVSPEHVLHLISTGECKWFFTMDADYFFSTETCGFYRCEFDQFSFSYNFSNDY